MHSRLMGPTGAARAAGTGAALPTPGNDATSAGSIKQGQTAFEMVSLALCTGEGSIGFLHGTQDFKSGIAILTGIFVDGHSGWLPPEKMGERLSQGIYSLSYQLSSRWIIEFRVNWKT